MARYSKVVRKRKKSGLARFFPERWQAFIARRLLDGVAGAMLLGGLFLLLAMISYAHTDPSLNTATDGAGSIANWMGRPGAYAADMLLQPLGLGALALAGVLALWGMRLMRRDPVSPLWTRFIAAVGAALLLAMASARLPSGGDWLTQAWMGGSAGGLMLNAAAGMMHNFIPSYSHSVAAGIAGVAAAGCLLWAAAVSRDEIAAFGAMIGNAFMAMGAAVASAFQSFIGWVSHYNDPDYEVPVTRKKAAAKKKIEV